MSGDTALVADIETNGFYRRTTGILCIAAQDADAVGPPTLYHGRGAIDEALERMLFAPKLVLHNGLGFDLPVIERLYPGLVFDRSRVFDTLVLSRLCFPERSAHSLDSWGKTLGFPKGKHTDFGQYSPQMGAYCVNDVALTVRVLAEICKRLEANEADGYFL